MFPLQNTVNSVTGEEYIQLQWSFTFRKVNKQSGYRKRFVNAFEQIIAHPAFHFSSSQSPDNRKFRFSLVHEALEPPSSTAKDFCSFGIPRCGLRNSLNVNTEYTSLKNSPGAPFALFSNDGADERKSLDTDLPVFTFSRATCQ